MVMPGEILPLDLTGLQPVDERPTPSQKAVRQTFEGWDQIKHNFEVIWSKVTAHEERVKGDHVAIRDQLSESMNYLNDIGAKARLLSAKLGRNPKAIVDGDTTVREALSELGNEFKEVKHATDGLPSMIQATSTKTDQQATVIQRLDVNMNKMYTHYKGYLVASNTRLAGVEKHVSNLLQDPNTQAQDGEFDFGQNLGSTQLTANVQVELQKLCDELAAIKHNQAAQRSPDTQLAGSIFPAISQEEIIACLKVVETRGSTGVTCDLGGTTFSSEADLRDYIKTHSIPTCAMYWDLFSIMVCMGAEGLTGKEWSDRIYSAEKGRTGSALEGELVASMSHKWPLCLYGEGARLARLDEGFARCKTYDQWIGGGNQVSYRQELSNQLLVYTDGIMGQIGAPTTPAHNLAHVLSNQVMMQWNDIVGFVDMFYLELVAKAKFNPTKAWKLVAGCVAAIFEATQPFRAKVILLEDSTKLDQKAAFMWAIFQTHRVIQTFIAVQFKSHPAIVKEISLFMVTERVDPKEILELGTRCKKAEGKAHRVAQRTKTQT
jgi:hypothetical protein